MMTTELLFMNDFDVTTCTATIINLSNIPDGRIDITLDKTCFYPRGGGQDWDLGIIKGNGSTFRVGEVRLDEHGMVHHIGMFDQGSFPIDSTVECRVDSERRQLNTRLHSASHVIDMAVNHLGLAWTPGKAAHYPHMSFVEYSGECDASQRELLKTKIESAVQAIIHAGGKNAIKFMPLDQMHTICRKIPINIPLNKPARVVIYPGEFGIPCGGTHVSDVKDIGNITITKIKKGEMGGNTIKVSYALSL